MSVLFFRVLNNFIKSYERGSKLYTKAQLKLMCDKHYEKKFISDEEYEKVIALVEKLEDR